MSQGGGAVGFLSVRPIWWNFAASWVFLGEGVNLVLPTINGTWTTRAAKTNINKGRYSNTVY